MRRVIVESPYAAPTPEGRDENITYLRRALRDCLGRGEAPFASHALYTQPGVLDDKVPEERTLGIEAGLVWGKQADATVVYMDRGVSEGMRMGIKRAQSERRSVEYRYLDGGDHLGCISTHAGRSLRSATTLLDSYLTLEAAMIVLDDADDPAADTLRDALDPIWRKLSAEDRAFLSARGLLTDAGFSPSLPNDGSES